MKEALTLAPTLTIARLQSRRGDAWLDLLAVLSFALSALMALTVGGGIWMFYGWVTDPSPTMVHSAESIWGTADPTSLFSVYLSLAVVAGALLIFPIFSLGTSAARLGASGRSGRLASLRLIGVTGSQTVAISLVETFVQWSIGTLVGVAAYFATLPLWHGVSFLGEPIHPSQMLLPARLVMTVLAILLVLALSSTIAGLQRVRISPLGVARREMNPALRIWRPLVFVMGVVGYVLWTRTNPTLTNSHVALVLAGMVLIVVGGISVAAPWALQIVARPLAMTRHVSLLLAMRRILDDPKAAWRNVSAIALLCFIAGFVAAIPDAEDVGFFQQDLLTGLNITLAFGFAVAALSTLMNQASTIFDRASQTYALSQVGFPRSIFGLTRTGQVLIPLVLATIFSGGLGAALGIAALAVPASPSGLVRITVTLLLGIGLSVLALAACEPLERHVLASQRRAND